MSIYYSYKKQLLFSVFLDNPIRKSPETQAIFPKSNTFGKGIFPQRQSMQKAPMESFPQALGFESSCS